MTSKRPKELKMATAKSSTKRRRPGSLIRKGLAEVLPTGVQKSYFMLTAVERDLLNAALGNYHPGQCDPILVGDIKVLKPALRLMGWYRLVIMEIKDTEVITSYIRWVDA